MESKIGFLFLGIIFCFFLSCIDAAVLKHSLNLCPDEESAKLLLGVASVDILGQATTGLVRRIRLPQFGLYEEPITCILATDTSVDDSGGEVEIVDGGIGHKFVEIRLMSIIGKGLDYLVLAYANRDKEMYML